MRLFIAIELDEGAREAVAAAQRRLQAAWHDSDRSALKWIRPEHMHLTLVFLGEVDASRSQAVADAVERPLAGERFQLELGGLGMFPPAGAPRVLWLGLTAGSPDVAAVQREMANRIEQLGIPLERRAFHPHLTLARWRESRPSDRRRLQGVEPTTAVTRLAVDAVALIHSRLTAAGPAYATICRG